ncbi:MAG: GSCFA domain-containing protein [Flavobacteriales bacterium]
MKLRTELPLPKLNSALDLFGGMVFLGSCFSDNIGGRLSSLGLPVLVNPFGVIFHPKPLFRILNQTLDSEFTYSENHIVEHQGVFHSLNHHGTFKSSDKLKLVDELNAVLALQRETLAQSKTLFLTLGTAWGYKLNNGIVANCHKLPNHLFKKELSGYTEVNQDLTHLLKKLALKLPDLRVILTVSPVRHIKNGLVENSRSKSILHAALHEAASTSNNAQYFPSFELMMDDLRDYRFYKKDLIHPSDMAIDYIFNYMAESLFSESDGLILKELERFKSLLSHRPLNPESDATLALKEKVEGMKAELQRKYPKLVLS